MEMKIKKRQINKNKREKKIFGTDGIRGRVGNFPLDHGSLIKLGDSFNSILFTDSSHKILIGSDTRKSGQEIINSITQHSNYFNCGAITSPGLSYLTRQNKFNYGIMVTASHNPYFDNGIKIFNGMGEKISDQLEEAIENHFYNQSQLKVSKEFLFKVTDIKPYLDFLIKIGLNLKREQLKLIIDCANGAASAITDWLFKELQIDCKVIYNQPDGENINRDCGSENPRNLIDMVITNKADLGIGFDGDGDRVIFIDPYGNLIDGDYILFVLAKHLLFDSYEKKEVVGTEVSNLGLEKALNDNGVKFIRAKVGDKNVYRELKKRNLFLGAEPSGHLINRKHQNTGDGILTALLFLKALNSLKMNPKNINKQFKKTPQRLINVPIKKRIPLSDWKGLQDKIGAFEEKFGYNSRILIRYSGTQAMIRIMLESSDEQVINQNMPEFKNFIEKSIGV